MYCDIVESFMNIISTKFNGLKIIKLKYFRDIRGYNLKIFEVENKLKFNCYESYISQSVKGGVRGLHGQKGKFSQSKLIFCLKGSFLDVAIDIRKKSKTFGKIFKKKIIDHDGIALLIPKGFLHGIISLKKNTIIINYNSNRYNRKKELGVNIKSLGLKLPKMKLHMSEKDKKLKSLKEFLKIIK